MQDERAVVKVEWHQIKLNGAPRMLGLIHSLLAITVREDQSQSSRTYVLEKAASQREDAGEEYQNGIYISCWSEVTSMITLPSLQTLNNVGAALTMKRLWEVAMSTGKYDLARSNCHHVAQAVYNACVPDSHAQLQVLEIPNARWVRVAAIVKPLNYLGLNLLGISWDPVPRPSVMAPSQAEKDLKSALMAKDPPADFRETERWLDAVAKAVKEGWDGLQIQQAVADVVAEDPVGCARFMETTHRPTQAMGVITMDDEAEEWEQSVHYHDKMIQGAFSAMWSTYPRIPQEDPWADNVPKVDCEVVCPGQGVVMTSSGLALRGEPVEGL
eukprot:g17657.t1